LIGLVRVYSQYDTCGGHAAKKEEARTLCGIPCNLWFYDWDKPFDAREVGCERCKRIMAKRGWDAIY